MNTYDQKDRVRGCLVGGATGDALGFPVEFIYSYQEICNRYGPQGITSYSTGTDTEEKHKAYISDDTQMTLFVACAILNDKLSGDATIPALNRAYVEWLNTQKGKRNFRSLECWVGSLPELNVRRAPGRTCMNSIDRIRKGGAPMNTSKGNGGLMRIAPIPLYGLSQGRITDIRVLDELAAETSEQTHLHPLGYIPSFVAAHLIYRLATDPNPSRESFVQYLNEALDCVGTRYAIFSSYVKQLRDVVEKALALAKEDRQDHEAIADIGEGWVAEETLAIAVYCTYRHFGDFEKSLIAAVNHAGDSDTIGAVTGNIHGAALGYDAIPERFKTDLELHDVIVHVADDLWRGYTTPYPNK